MCQINTVEKMAEDQDMVAALELFAMVAKFGCHIAKQTNRFLKDTSRMPKLKLLETDGEMCISRLERERYVSSENSFPSELYPFHIKKRLIIHYFFQ